MKLINIKCFDNGSAELTTSDFHISSENKASKLVIDFSETIYQNSSKWVDLILANGTSLRYELGNDPIVEHELLDEETIAGVLKITPFVIEDDRKIKYIPNYDVIIKKQPDAGDNEAPQRDDYIFSVVKNAISNIEINQETFKLTFTNFLGETYEIDLPFEAVIERGYVDNTTNELVLELQNGIEKRINLPDLKSDIENGIIIPLKARQDEEGNNIIQFYAKKTDIEMHEQNTNNPHNVTKEQVGLSNVDNTADIDKPISNATQIALSILDNKKLDKSLKGASGGVAELDENGKVLTSQLPSYVDDVLTFDSLSSFPVTGENSKIYVAKDTNKIYRWGGTSYVEISASLALGVTSSTAHRGDHGKIAYDHSQETGNPHNTRFSELKDKPTTIAGFGITDAVEKVAGKGLSTYDYDDAEKQRLNNATSHIADNNNPHNVTKEQIGLGNVNNTSDADKPISTAQQTKFDLIDTQISNLNYNKVDKFITINGKRLDESIILTKNDFADLNNVDNTSDLDKPISTATLNELNKKISLTEKGSANGVAPLDANTKIPSQYLPSFVDDVIEGYLSNGKFYQDAELQIEITPENNKIYVDKITNNTFRWSGSQYIEISQSLALGETENTAYRGDRGKIAYEKSLANEQAINNAFELINTNHEEVNNRIDSIVNANIVEIEFTEPITYIEDAIIDAPQEIIEIRGKSEVIITDEVLEIASWKVSEELKNEIITDEYGQKRLVENVRKYIIKESDIFQLYTNTTNVDLIFIYKPIDYIGYNNTLDKNNIKFIEYPYKPWSPIDDVSNIGHTFTTSAGWFTVIVAKGTYNNLTEAQNALKDKVIYYELAVKNPKSKVIQDGDVVSTIITSYANLDYIQIYKPIDYIGNNSTTINGGYSLEGYTTQNISPSNYDSVDNIGKVFTTAHSQRFYLGIAKSSHTVETARDLLRGKILTYELATPRLAQTEGIASVVNPVIESKSLEENSTKLQITGTYNSIPGTDIKDRIINDNGVYRDEINIKKIVVEETTNDGTNYFIDYPSDYKQNSNIFVENIKLTDDGTKLLYPMKYGNPIGKEMIYQLAEPIVKQSEVAIMDDLIFKQGYTIYLSSEQLAPTMLAKCAYNLGAQVKMLVDDSRSQVKSIEENKDNIANLQNEVNKFVFVSETEFGNITREDGKVYGVYDETTGIITWYYGDIGGINE